MASNCVAARESVVPSVGGGRLTRAFTAGRMAWIPGSRLQLLLHRGGDSSPRSSDPRREDVPVPGVLERRLGKGQPRLRGIDERQEVRGESFRGFSSSEKSQGGVHQLLEPDKELRLPPEAGGAAGVDVLQLHDELLGLLVVAGLDRLVHFLQHRVELLGHRHDLRHDPDGLVPQVRIVALDGRKELERRGSSLSAA